MENSLSLLVERPTAINLVDKKLSRLNSTMAKSMLFHWLMQVEEGQQQKRQEWERSLLGRWELKAFIESHLVQCKLSRVSECKWQFFN